MEGESPTLNDWELKTYGQVNIQIVHCFSISVVYQIVQLKVLDFKFQKWKFDLYVDIWYIIVKDLYVDIWYIIVKENNKSKKNKKNQSDLIRSLPYKTYRKFVKISYETNYGNKNMKHIRNEKMY